MGSRIPRRVAEHSSEVCAEDEAGEGGESELRDMYGFESPQIRSAVGEI